MSVHLPTQTNVWDLELGREGGNFSATMCLSTAPLAELLLVRERQLTTAENARLDGIPSERRRFSFLCGRVAAKAALVRLRPGSDPAVTEIAEGVFGQPVVSGANLAGVQVTISHAEGIGGAIAFPEAHPMGLDIETVRPDLDRTIQTQMTAREMELHRALPLASSTGFALLWTIKESLSKVLKCGLMTPMAIFEANTIEASRPVFVTTFANFAQYKTLSVVRGGTVISVTLPKRTEVNLDFLVSG